MSGGLGIPSINYWSRAWGEAGEKAAEDVRKSVLFHGLRHPDAPTPDEPQCPECGRCRLVRAQDRLWCPVCERGFEP